MCHENVCENFGVFQMGGLHLLHFLDKLVTEYVLVLLC